MVPDDAGELEQDGDGDDVVEHRHVGDEGEAPHGVQHRSHQADRPVAEQLDGEEPEEVRRDLPFGSQSGCMCADGVQVDDERRRQEEHDGGAEEDHAREGHDSRDRVLRLVAWARRQPMNELRDERRRQHAAEHEVVDDVRRVVGEVERVRTASCHRAHMRPRAVAATR